MQFRGFFFHPGGGGLLRKSAKSSDRTVPLDEPIECNEATLAFWCLAFGQMGDAYITLDIQAAILQSYTDRAYIDVFFLNGSPKRRFSDGFFFVFGETGRFLRINPNTERSQIHHGKSLTTIVP